MAWIGLPDENSRLNISNLAGDQAAVKGMQEYSGMDFKHPLLRNTPTGKVLLRGNYAVSNNVQQDPEIATWKAGFVQHGINACISLQK